MTRCRPAVACTLSLLALGTIALAAPGGGTAERRPLALDDLSQIRAVSDAEISPDGTWVAYTVSVVDAKQDAFDDDVWMSSWDGQKNLRLTTSKESENTPRFSPDGIYLAFLSGREDDDGEDQIWLLNRSGGEAEQVTSFKGGVTDYVWSPDGKRLAVIALDPDPNAADASKTKDDKIGDHGAGDDKPGDDKDDKKTPPPIVIDRFQFKEDIAGYLGKRRHHLYLFDLATRKAETLTPGDHDELLPAFSPDGKSIAFVTKRGPDPDRHDNWDIYLIDARTGAAARPVTTNDVADDDPSWESRPAWSPDGKSIAYLQGGPQKLIYYAVDKLAVIPVAGGAPRLLTADLDRTVTKPRFSADGASIIFLLEDDRSVHLARIPAAGGKIERLTSGRRILESFDLSRNGRIAAQVSTPSAPTELFAVEGSDLRPLSRQNDPLLAKLKLGATEEISFKSKDGTVVDGLYVKPPDWQQGKRYPTILQIHGGPVGQFGNEFMDEWQLFAANGYVVVGANPRGSSGRGQEYCKAIYADWGNKDAQDVLAAVDHLTDKGIADPNHLGVGGWSYGGILTNYVIAQDTRFKAATSGASISNILAGYGTDMYIREYEQELGVPWKNPEAWTRLSFPFLHADKIVTPTLFLGGDKDFNVPLLNSEQMYQALKSLGRDTQLIIYPGQFHGLSKPSYIKDRYERYLAWFGAHLK